MQEACRDHFYIKIFVSMHSNLVKLPVVYFILTFLMQLSMLLFLGSKWMSMLPICADISSANASLRDLQLQLAELFAIVNICFYNLKLQVLQSLTASMQNVCRQLFKRTLEAGSHLGK